MKTSTSNNRSKNNLSNENDTQTGPKWGSNVIKATLKHLNGQVSEIKLIVPFYGRSGEISELGQRPLSNYIDSLTTCFIQIESYRISLGHIDSNGNEAYCGTYPEKIIPLNKVYSKGKWVDPVKERMKAIKKQLAS